MNVAGLIDANILATAYTCKAALRRVRRNVA